MRQTDHSEFFKKVALYHKSLGNGVSSEKRFFRSGIDEDLNIHDEADLPCLILYDYYGTLEDGSDVKDVMVGKFEIRGKVDDPKDFNAIDELKDLCKRIGFDIVNLMNLEYEEHLNQGPVPGFYLGAVTYDFTGPIQNGYYGCAFGYPMKSEAFNKYTFNKGEVFPGMD